MNDDLEYKVKQWITESGYALEMNVAQQLAKVGFNVTQADFYEDYETLKFREIDIWASKQKYMDDFMFRVNFVLECKKSSKPWILFTSPDLLLTDEEFIKATRSARFASSYGLLLTAIRSWEDDIDSPLPLLELPNRMGHGLTQAFTRSKDIAFDVLSGVIKASIYYMKRADQTEKPSCEIAFPIIVLDGNMLECYVEDKEIKVKQIAQGLIHWRSMTPGNAFNFIHIITLDEIDLFIQKAKTTAENILADDKILQLMASKMQKKVDHEHGQST